MTTLEQIRLANPHLTYGQSIGYAMGKLAKAMQQPNAALSEREWREAKDDYAIGYRQAFNEPSFR